MLLMIDNYDSFTYNLVQYFGELGEDVRVMRNDEITLDEIAALKPERICISPGPCTPHEAGHLVATSSAASPASCRSSASAWPPEHRRRRLADDVVRAKALMHGKTSPMHHTGVGVFRGLPIAVRTRRATTRS